MANTFQFTSAASSSVNENVAAGGLVYTAAASVAGVSGKTVYAITGGADAALFDLNADTGVLSFKTSPDYEAPADAGANNVYDLQIRALETTSAPSTAEFQISNVVVSPSGLLTAQIWTKTSDVDSFDITIGATGGSGLSFANAPSGWTLLPNLMGDQLNVGAYAITPLGGGPCAPWNPVGSDDGGCVSSFDRGRYWYVRPERTL